MITDTEIAAFYDWLSRSVQVTNWVAYRDRFASFTMHKRLHAEPNGRRTAGVEYVNDRVLDAAGLGAGAHVLDAGCGFGGTVFHWHGRIGGRYEGVTISPVQHRIAVREARRRGIGAACRFRVQSYDDPLGGGFDAVVAIESLIHSSDLGHTVANLAAALRPGGTLLVLDDMATGDLDSRRPREAGLLRTHWGCGRYPTEHDYREAITSAGLRLTGDEDLSPLMRPRPDGDLDRLEATYARLHRTLAVRPVRTVVSAFLGGIALERLHASGDVRYRLLVARA
ncbi:MAG: SAM-dependent methyltransferase [Acidimicrobiales bacterium]